MPENMKAEFLSLCRSRKYKTVGEREKAFELFMSDKLELFALTLTQEFHALMYDDNAEEFLERAIEKTFIKL